MTTARKATGTLSFDVRPMGERFHIEQPRRFASHDALQRWSKSKESVVSKMERTTKLNESKVSSDSMASRSSSSSNKESRNSDSPATFTKVACVGAGKMAQAVLEPMIHSGLQPPELVTIYDVNAQIMTAVQDKLPGIRTAIDLPQCVAHADLVICAVKPNNLTPAFFQEIQKVTNDQSLRGRDAILLSVVAGKPIDSYTPAGYQKIVRSMPNTPAAIGEGMTVWSCTPSLNTMDRENVRKVLSCFGESVRSKSLD
jgi:NADP oxidoreductase coenzyme F420-dependent